MTRIMVRFKALLAQSWLEHGSYEPGVAGSSPARSIYIFHVLRESVSWSMPRRLSRRPSGSQVRILLRAYLFINNNFRVIINFHSNI